MDERKSVTPQPPRVRTPEHVQPLPEFEALPDIEPMTPITPIEGLELQPDASVADLEPAFDLSITDIDVSPLEGLESAADPDQFAIDPEVGGTSPIEGLIQTETSANEPGLGEPLSSEDPLAGLNVLEDDSFYSNDEGPLAPREVAAARSAPATSKAEYDFPDIEPLDLHLEAPEVEAEREPEPAAEREPEPEPEPEVEPEPEPERVEAPPPPPPPRVAHKTPPRKEAEPEEEEEEAETPAPEPPKPSRPKLVEPLRMTRPKPKVETPKAKEPEPEERAAAAERRPLNPFQRQRPKGKNSGPKGAPRVATPPAEVPRAATPKENAPAPHRADDHFVDLGDWLRQESGPRSYRMVAEEDANREEGEEADFTDMLEKFKAGVAANVDDEDFDSHYDLGVAYREMGLIDEAIFEFQKALRGATQRIRAYEALGQCFIDRSEFDVAITVLGRALREPGMEDEDLIGVLYLLGFASEGSRKPRDAAAYYQRVFAIDIDFRDVSKRLKQMTKAASK
jgi:hypothetical protein